MVYKRVPGETNANIVVTEDGRVDVTEGRAQVDRLIEPATAVKCKAFLSRFGSIFAPITTLIRIAAIFTAVLVPHSAGHIQ